MQYTLAELSLLIACPACKQKGLKSWYYDAGYSYKKKAFVLTVHFECCICDNMVTVHDNKLKLEVYNNIQFKNDDDCLHSF